MKDYIVLPTCTVAEFSALNPLAITPFQDGGYCRVRLAVEIAETVNVIKAPTGDYVLPSGELLGVFA